MQAFVTCGSVSMFSCTPTTSTWGYRGRRQTAEVEIADEMLKNGRSVTVDFGPTFAAPQTTLRDLAN